jgi:hypothetical protein
MHPVSSVLSEGMPMRNRLVAVAAWALLITSLGCGGSSGPTKTGGLANSYICTFATTEGICFEWTATRALTSDEQAQLQTGCRLYRPGTFLAGGSCPIGIGTCTLTTSQVSDTTLKYQFYSPPWNPVTAQSACASLGTWN